MTLASPPSIQPLPSQIEHTLLTKSVHAALLGGEFASALHQATDALRHYEQAGDGEGIALAFCLQGKCYRRLEDLPASLAAYDESLRRYEALGNTRGMADVLQARSGALRLIGRDADCTRDLTECCRLYHQLGDTADEMRGLMGLAIQHKQAGNLAAAQELLFQCLAYFEAQQEADPNSPAARSDMAKVLLNLATNYSVLENPAETVRFARRGIPLFEAMGDQHSLSMALSVLGAGYINLGDYETALEQCQASLQIAERVGIDWVVAIALDDTATALRHLKYFDEAQVALERCLALNINNSNRLVYAGNLTSLGRLYAQTEWRGCDPHKALTYLRESQQIAEAQGAGMFLAEVYQALTEVYTQLGDFAQALTAHRAYHEADKRLFNAESDRRIQQLEVEKAQKDAEIAHLRMVELAAALTEAQRLHALADAQARTDGLTGVLNRRALDEGLRAATDQAREAETPLSVALVDMDFFKKINDRLGHEVGDTTLRRAAHLLRSQCRDTDLVARYGGEEFALVFPETDLTTALALCERLRELMVIQEWTRVHPSLSSVTVSIGVSSLDPAAPLDTPATLLARADQNLYRAKNAGRNQVVG